MTLVFPLPFHFESRSCDFSFNTSLTLSGGDNDDAQWNKKLQNSDRKLHVHMTRLQQHDLTSDKIKAPQSVMPGLPSTAIYLWHSAKGTESTATVKHLCKPAILQHWKCL